MSNRPDLAQVSPVSPPLGKPRLLLADDHALFTTALRRLLEPEFEIVGTVPNGRLLLQQAPSLSPNVILLDLLMPFMNGTESGHRLNALLPETKIIVVTASEDVNVAAEALGCWAAGFVLKKAAAEELVHAINVVLRGAKYITPSLRRQIKEASCEGLKTYEKRLTPRQREVLQCLAEGHSMKETASILEMKVRTVAFHKYKMMQDLGLKNNSDLLRLAIKERLMYMP
jgi:DNA-binding NarL/FixJ family response regulator